MSYNELDLNLIKVFVAVYESGSFLVASKKLFVSQPAVSGSIKRLENSLGGKLFIRASKGVMPTAEGESFYKTAVDAMDILNGGIKRFSALAGLESGTLNIGSSSTIIRKILLPFIADFNKRHPKIIITVTDANSEELTHLVKAGVVDLAIFNMPIKDSENFIVKKVTTTHDCFIASVDFEKDFLSKDDLKNTKLILQKRPSSNRDYFDKMCEFNNVDIVPSFEIGSFGLITDFVCKNLGVAYTVKEFVLDDIKSKRVKEIKSDFVVKPRAICVITSKVATNSFSCERFISELCGSKV